MPGFCYWPGCEEPVARFVDGEHILNLEIAHRAVSSDGKRFDPELSLDEKNAFSNLLLLCKVHHVRVDGHDSGQYTVELLGQRIQRKSRASSAWRCSGVSRRGSRRLAAIQGAKWSPVSGQR